MAAAGRMQLPIRPAVTRKESLLLPESFSPECTTASQLQSLAIFESQAKLTRKFHNEKQIFKGRQPAQKKTPTQIKTVCKNC